MKGILAIAAALALPKAVIQEFQEFESSMLKVQAILPPEAKIDWRKECSVIAKSSITHKTSQVGERLFRNLQQYSTIEAAMFATKEQVEQDDEFYRQYGYKRGMFE